MPRKEINIIGFGVMGCQIAALFNVMGYHVNIVARKDRNLKRLQFSTKIIRKSLQIDSCLEGSMKIYSDIENISDACTIEAVAEDLALKKEIYFKVRNISAMPFLSNTSSLSPREIGKDVFGVHFFNPIQIGIIEFCLGVNKQYDKSLQGIIDDLKSFNFNIVEVNQNRGDIGNYLLFNEISSVFKLIETFDYEFEKIAMIYKSLYPHRDIFSIIDIIGTDVVLSILINLKSEDKSIYIPQTLKKAIVEGVYGKKNRTSILSLLEKI